MKLENKVAIITGAAGGIGKEIAHTFIREGASVCIADIDPNAAENTARELTQNGGKAIAIAMDVTDEAVVESGVDKVVKEFNAIDILVSNAGIQHLDRVENLSFENWRKLMAIHVDGAFLTTKACLRHMYKSDRGGSIIYMGSVHSKEASPMKAPYVTAKHGLIGLCKVVAMEGAEYGVRANVICPGFVLTPLVEKQIPRHAKERGISEERVIKEVLLKGTVDSTFTTTADVAELALFFASFPSNALTGQSVVVSHGWHMQ